MSWCRFQMFSSKSAVFVLVTRQPVFGLPSAIACGFRLFSPAVVFIPPIFRFYSFADDSMSGCHFQTFHRNRLFLFRSPVSPCLHTVSYSTRFSTIFTRGHFHPPIFRLPPFAYYSMYGCRFQTFSPKSAVFRSVRPSAHFCPPESYSTRFSTVFIRGRFHPSIFRLPLFAYDSMSGCHFQFFSPKSGVFVPVARQPVFSLPCT
jgi:hypothetical protein